jgi:hypothetical protein
MRTVIDYNTKVVLGAGSEEMEASFKQAQSQGQAFVEFYMAGCKYRVFVSHEPDLVRRLRSGEPRALFFDPEKHAPKLENGTTRVER